jgi:hypothetical protein
LDARQQALDLADADLKERERRALTEEPTPEELRAFADERDKLATLRSDLAEAYDELARERDEAGLARDVRGSGRDRAARERDADGDDAAVDRFVAGWDRDLAAGDRVDSLGDRRRAAAARRAATDDRERAATDRDIAAHRAEDLQQEIDGLREALRTRLQIGQAEGLLIARYGLEPDAAFRLLIRLSQETDLKLRDVAARLVADACPPTQRDTEEGESTSNRGS